MCTIKVCQGYKAEFSSLNGKKKVFASFVIEKGKHETDLNLKLDMEHHTIDLNITMPYSEADTIGVLEKSRIEYLIRKGIAVHDYDGDQGDEYLAGEMLMVVIADSYSP